MRQSRTLDLGLDVHKDAMAVAYVADEHGAEVTDLGTIGTRHCDIDQLVRTPHANATHVVFVYEAGPCGAWLARDLTQKGHRCWVVAPSLLPKQAGDRVNTDRRDAGQLARLMRSGDLTAVYVPAVEDDASRDRSRAREDAIAALKTAKCRLNALLRRHALRETGRATWGPAHLRWLAAVVCATPAQHIVFQEAVRAVHEPTARLQRLVQERPDQGTSWRLHPVVEALEALRGVQFTVAVTLVAERGDLTRVEHPRQLLKSLGLIPSAYSRGERRRQGSITNVGHTHARRALVEGAWASRDSRQGQSASPTAARTTPQPPPGPQLEGARPTVHTLSTLDRPRHTCQSGGGGHCPGTGGLSRGHCDTGSSEPVQPPNDCHETPTADGLPRLSAEAQPRYGATLDGVTRPPGLLVPRVRQAPDGCQSGGTQPTDTSRSTRRM